MTALARRVRRELFIAVVFGWFVVVSHARFELVMGATVLFVLAAIVDEATGRG